MDNRIIFKNDAGGVSIVAPAQSCMLPIERIAQKDVPDGVPYWIVPATDIPSDRTFRNAWELDEKAMGEPHGIGNHAVYLAWVESERLRVEEEERIAEENRIKELANLFAVEGGVQE